MKRVKQINNIVIKYENAIYLAYNPMNECIFQNKSLQLVEDFCRKEQKYLKKVQDKEQTIKTDLINLQVNSGLFQNKDYILTRTSDNSYDIVFFGGAIQVYLMQQNIKRGSKVTVYGILPENCATLFANTDIGELIFIDVDSTNVMSMTSMFRQCIYLKKIDMKCLDVSNVLHMDYMFSNCGELLSIKHNFNTWKVQTMEGMFAECNKLSSLDLSELLTQRVENMSAMFKNCRSLKYLDLTSFNTRNVYTMKDMFLGCKKLRNLDFKFNTVRVENMSYMFKDCESLERLHLESINTEQLYKAVGMFINCIKLNYLNLGNFTVTSKLGYALIFENCSSLINGTLIACDELQEKLNRERRKNGIN